MTPSGRTENGNKYTSKTDLLTLDAALERTVKELLTSCHSIRDHEPNPDSKSLQRAKAVNEVVRDYFTQTISAEFPELRSVLKVESDYVNEVVKLGKAMKDFQQNVLAAGETDETDEKVYVDELIRTSGTKVVGHMCRVLDVLETIVEDAESDVREPARKISKDIYPRLTALSAAYEVQANAASVEVHGASDSVAFGNYFEKRATRERRTAEWLRAAAILLLMSITGLAGFILFGSSLDSSVLGAELARLSTTVPLAVLAGYLSRESSRHRSTSDRYGELGAHLLHLDSYIAKLSIEEQRRYRYELGQRAFVAECREVGDAGSPGLLSEITQFVETLKNVASRESK